MFRYIIGVQDYLSQPLRSDFGISIGILRQFSNSFTSFVPQTVKQGSGYLKIAFKLGLALLSSQNTEICHFITIVTL